MIQQGKNHVRKGHGTQERDEVGATGDGNASGEGAELLDPLAARDGSDRHALQLLGERPPLCDAPVALTEGERKSYRIGVLAAGAIYADAVGPKCRARLENLRIAIAARSVECEAPEFWPTRGDE